MLRDVRAILPSLVCLLPLAAFAQPPGDFSADRPGFGESTDTLAPGFLQLEAGFLAAPHNISFPLPLLRIGLTPRLELRIEADGFKRESDASGSTRELHYGGSDISLGAKVRLLREGPRQPAVSLLASVSLPVGTSYFSSGSFDPEFHLIWAKSLPRGFDASGNLNQAWQTGGPHWTSRSAASFQLGHGIAAGLHGYGEVYRVWPIPAGESAPVVASGGVSRPVGSNAQVDVEAGHTMLARTPSWFVGFGFAIRRR